ncbi:fungal-specific transcription factor domain-containing protein [Cantharellus anzutake]|uniref:fungal-specific transcription factor domain-containing protein n=1 Tax=Cantharellus anzutake TaxID=1750568 RepID=UPI0019033F81|nr:fungal-specific transcription factor domain-containing protein [Cantharellus anzutake]KAF8308168.1 fungal-specific transcription factor domain-containing protein [Cantharellus anzutake]
MMMSSIPLQLAEDYDDDALFDQLGISAKDRAVRRRSSRACDSCRKIKSRCEPPSASGEPCKSCALLGLAFRRLSFRAMVCPPTQPPPVRGPPKGYIDAIETRLHQLEAILGTFISTSDPRAQGLIANLRQDGLASAVIDRVDSSPFGTKARISVAAQGSFSADKSKAQRAQGPRKAQPAGSKVAVTQSDDPNEVDPYDWQNRLERLMQLGAGASSPSSSYPLLSESVANDTLPNWTPTGPSNQRRRIGDPSAPLNASTSDSGGINNSQTNTWSPPSAHSASSPLSEAAILPSDRHQSHGDSEGTGDDESDELSQMGQLSIDDHSDVRYHGRTSGLHLLANASASAAAKVTISGRRDQLFHPLSQSQSGDGTSDNNSHTKKTTEDTPGIFVPSTGQKGGIWYFPRSGVWPAVDPSKDHRATTQSQSSGSREVSYSPRGYTTGAPLKEDSPSSDQYSARGSSITDGSSLPGKLKHTVSPAVTWIGPSQPDPEGDLAERDPILVQQRLASIPTFIEERDLDLVVVKVSLPPRDELDELMALYWRHVHPVLPVVHKAHFQRSYRAAFDGTGDDYSQENSQSSEPAPKPISLTLLYAMMASASRYTNDDKESVPKMSLWSAGLEYADKVRQLIYWGKIPSRLSTIQALVLVGYLDVGVGAMAVAWQTAGLAVRTAQDIGLNRSVDKWVSHAGTSVYSDEEKEACRRIWYSLMLIDIYISTYIGRPCSILRTDYDTHLPQDLAEDALIWEHLTDESITSSSNTSYVAGPCHIILCFRHRATLSCIMADIIHKVYAIRPASNRTTEATNLEIQLDKWYYDLPEPLRYVCPKSDRIPAPHIVTLHMDYWCTVLLLHRPFIRVKAQKLNVIKSEAEDVAPSPSAVRYAQKAYSLCEKAANMLVAIVSAYADNFSMEYCPAFITFFLFTASIMHVTILFDSPGDVQSTQALKKAMEILEQMSIVWPSAGRAWDVLNKSRANIHEAELTSCQDTPERHKRAAEDDLEVSQFHTANEDHLEARPNWAGAGQDFVQPSYPASAKFFPVTSTAAPIHPAFLDGAPDPAQQQDKPLFSHPPQAVPQSLPDSGQSISGFENFTSSSINSQLIPNQWANTRDQVPEARPPISSLPQQPLQHLPQQHLQHQTTSYEYDSRYLPPPHPSYAESALVNPLSNRTFTEQPFWTEFAANDPFGDPSSLSASLYSLPLVLDNGRNPRGPEPVPTPLNAPSMFQMFDRQGVPSIDRFGYPS